MYRGIKRTTKKTQGYCLNCKYHKVIREYPRPYGTIIECTAENRCITTEFNTNDYYCVEYKSINDMSKTEKERIADAARAAYAKKGE